MKASEIVVGGLYLAKVNGRVVTVRVDRVGENMMGRPLYHVTNTLTGRATVFRSAVKFRGWAPVKAIEKRRLEADLGYLADAAVRGAITPAEHDARHAALLAEEAVRRGIPKKPVSPAPGAGKP